MLTLLLLSVGSCATIADGSPTEFTLSIKNVSHNSTLPTPLAPGVFVVHDRHFRLYDNEQPDRNEGLEALAEDGNPATLAQSIAGNSMTRQTGVFNTPGNDSSPGLLLPNTDGNYQFTFQALPGDRLSFATMLVQSNDLFLGPADGGLVLFRVRKPITGDITDKIKLWDAGTEINEEPAKGQYQAPRQSTADSGPAENGNIAEVDDGFFYPLVNQLVEITLSVTDNKTN